MILLSNVEFEKLYKQFSLMIKSFIKKYKELLEEDEIHQCCCIAIMKAYKSYNSHRDTKLSNWIYQNMEWQILRELSKENKHKDVISINSTVESDEGDTVSLLDLIADDLNLEEEIKDKLMLDYYKKECRRVLGNDFKIAYLKWFQNMSCKAIESILSIDKASYRVNNCRRKLIQKSSVFNKEYMKINGISDYNTEKMALLEA